MKARSQTEHNKINAREYPGTRQLCIECDEPTERCENDSLWSWQMMEMGGYSYGPLCTECYNKLQSLEGDRV